VISWFGLRIQGGNRDTRQRVQAVRPVEAYRNLVLKTDQPPLGDVRQELGRLVEQEKSERLPVMLSRAEIARLLPIFRLDIRLLRLPPLAQPVRMETALLVQSLVRVSAEIITLCLQQVRR